MISLPSLWLVLRADYICSMLKPLITSFPGRVIFAIDDLLSLFWLCRIVVKIHLKLPDFKPRKVGQIDNKFVGIVTIFFYDADS
jgi:hypothetical protein